MKEASVAVLLPTTPVATGTRGADAAAAAGTRERQSSSVWSTSAGASEMREKIVDGVKAVFGAGSSTSASAAKESGSVEGENKPTS